MKTKPNYNYLMLKYHLVIENQIFINQKILFYLNLEDLVMIFNSIKINLK